MLSLSKHEGVLGAAVVIRAYGSTAEHAEKARRAAEKQKSRTAEDAENAEGPPLQRSSSASSLPQWLT